MGLSMETPDRVRAHTADSVNDYIDRQIDKRIRDYSHKGYGAISQRIEALEREWDIERVLEMNASFLAFSGLALGLLRDKRWLIVPGIVLPFLFQHAVQGWCPPLPVLRRLGFRTREEIDREKYALKALRGDFVKEDSVPRAESALQAVKD